MANLYRVAMTKTVYLNIKANDAEEVDNWMNGNNLEDFAEEIELNYDDRIIDVFNENSHEYHSLSVNVDLCKEYDRDFLKKRECFDYYEIVNLYGTKYITILDYFYSNGEDNGKGEYRCQSYSGFSMPLTEFLANMNEPGGYDIMQEKCSQYITDMTEEEVLMAMKARDDSGFTRFLSYDKLNEFTECGKYIEGR